MFYPLEILTRFWRSEKLLSMLLLAFLLNFFFVYPLNALTELSSFAQIEDSLPREQVVVSKSQEGLLQEVPAPGVTEKIRSRLLRRRPELKILSPANGEILLKTPSEKWQIIIGLKDWPLFEDPVLGLGPHLVVQIDDEKPLRITHLEGENIVVPLDGLNPGTHRLAAYLAFPWGEILKDPATSDESRISFFKKTEGTQPVFGQPWLTVANLPEASMTEPFLIDSLIWNAPLQGLKDGDDNWRLKISINGESFLLDRQEAIWIQGLSEDINIVQFQLLNKFGELIDPLFNNKVKVYTNTKSKIPVWMNSSLQQNDILKLAGDNSFLEEFKEIDEQSDSKSKDNKLIDDLSINDYDVLFSRRT